MDIEVWEADIITRLGAAGLPEGIEVIPMPETPEEYERKFDKHRVTVAFNAAKWRENEATDLINQVADIDFAIIVQSKFLRGADGVYSIFKKVKKYLVGFAPTGCRKLKSKDFMLYSDEKDLFTFLYFVTCPFYAAEFIEDDEELAAARINRITGDEEILYDPALNQTSTKNNAVFMVEQPHDIIEEV